MESNDGLHQYRFAAAGLSDNHVALTIEHLGGDTIQYDMAVKTLMNVFYRNHQLNISLVKKISRKRITTIDLTTAFVDALPTSSAPPRAE